MAEPRPIYNIDEPASARQVLLNDRERDVLLGLINNLSFKASDMDEPQFMDSFELIRALRHKLGG